MQSHLEEKLIELAHVEADSIWVTTTLPEDPLFLQQNYFAQIDAAEGWEQRASAAGIIIGLLDTGIQLDHPDLISAIAINTAEVPTRVGMMTATEKLTTYGVGISSKIIMYPMISMVMAPTWPV
ncbi:MAG: hypothetical protein LR015_01680 [Verrucomicrobia bacterium]|nr:hypothetical protein [Verrucomicrobiota bacterium]